MTMYPQLGFLRESIRNLRETGSVAPSSRFLCRSIASKIDPEKAQVVIELGPGDGVITRYLLDRLKPTARLLIFEINPVFVEKIRSTFQDPRLTVIHDSAEHIGRYLISHGIEAVDYVVSGIPFIMLPDVLAEDITAACKTWLRTGGGFIQFHYSPTMINFYRKLFGNVDVDFIPLNIPPAFVVYCRK
jgi:phospholipid N-methyltransferase